MLSVLAIEDERTQSILDLVTGRDVLDVGCVRGAKTEDWLHREICKRARHAIGIDIAEQEVRELQSQYNIVYGDAHTINLSRQFEVVVAGELIEHLENPGLFLENMLKHLNPGGRIIITTPNPFYPKRILEILFRGDIDINEEHTCWYCHITLTQLLKRVGFEDVDIRFTNSAKRFHGLGRLPSLLLRRKFSSHIVAVARKPERSSAEVGSRVAT